LIYGICTAGGPLGELVLAWVAAVGVASVGWRPTMLAMGVAVLVVVLPITVLLLGRAGRPASVDHKPLPSFAATLRLAFRSRGFLLLLGAYFICGLTTLGLVHTHIVPYGEDRGLGPVTAAQILGLVGLANVFGVVAAGRVGDRWGGRRPIIVVFTIRAVALLGLATAATAPDMGFWALLFGLTDMATIPLSAAVTTEMFGPQMLGALVGLLVVAHQLGAATGSFVAGVGYEWLGGYPPVILAGVGAALLAAILCFAMDTSSVLVERAPHDEPGLAASGA
jgi:predicted MFS family arabinose efflux permease